MKKLLLFLLAVMLMFPAVMQAQETLTIADGTETNEYLPLYGYYADSEQETQMIYPASMLDGIVGAEISSITFYSSATTSFPDFTVKIGETTTSSYSSTTFLPTTSMTTVFDGTLTVSGGEMTIQFSTPYTYNGGNLILDFSTGGDAYINCEFLGITSTGGGIWYYYYYDDYWEDEYEEAGIENFLPKVTITYTGGTTVTCPSVSALTASDVDDQSATLSWTAGGTESSWDIYYTTTATDVPDETTEAMETSADVIYQLSGLNTSTTYYVYVRANCGSGDVSRWKVVSFSTAQIAAEFPYTQDWEDDAENSQWQFVHSTGVNQWVVGTAVNNTPDGEKSLYVSNDYGVSNVYTNTSTSTSWAYRDIDFGTYAEYLLSFDWRNQGESSYYDFLKVFIGAPSNPSASSHEAPAGATLLGTYAQKNTWQHVDVSISSEHQGVQRLYLLWWNDGSVGTNPPAAIDNIVITGTDCGTPLSATVSEVAGQTATLTWTPAGDESSWDIYYTNVSTDIPNAETEPTETVYDAEYYFSDLTPVTTYYAYVRANCGDQVSNWKAASSFTTTQIAAELPYTQDWEIDEENNQWQFVHSTSGSNKWVVGTAVNNTPDGEKALYVSNDYGVSNAYTNTSTSTSWAYRDIDFGTYAEYVLSFDWRNQGESNSFDYLKVYVGTPSNPSASSHDTPSGATLLGTYSQKNTWQHVDLSISSDCQGVQRLYLLWWNDGSVGTNPPAAIDNIEIIGTDCGTPHSVTATEITTDAISISFVPASENDDTWEVAILNHGDTIDDNTEIITVYDTTYTFEALEANTVYDVYVRTACGSLWKMASGIHTECVVITDLPFVDNFDNAPSSSVMPYCWTRINTYSSGSYPYTTTTHYSEPYSLYFYASSGSYNIAVSPEFDQSIDINTLQTTFMYKSGGASYYMIVGVMTDPEDATTFVAVDTVYPDASSYSNWIEREVKFDSYTGDGHYIAFKNNNYSYGYIDDVMIYPIPSCTRPDEVSVTATTESSVSFTWTPVGEEAAWEYLCVPYGTEVDETTAEWAMTEETTAEITDLLNNTLYTIYVRAYCSDAEQSMSRTVDFRTDCGVMPFPYIENFESFAASEVVPCWTVMNGSAAVSTSYPCSGSKSLRLYGTENNMVAMPQLDREITEVELSFSTRPESFTNSSCGSFQVGYVTDLTNSSSFVAVETYSYDDFSECQNVDIVFANAPAGSYIAFRQFNCSSSWYWFIDDIDVHEIPSCIKPQNFSVVSSSISKVSLEWVDAGTAMTWNVAYGTGSFDPDEATNVETVYDTFVEIMDITPGVMNTFYVQADCGGETSRWAGPLSLIPGIYTFGHTGSDTITGCGYTIYDEGGASGSYTHNADFTLVIYPEEEGQHVGVTGTYNTESSYDKLFIYDGAGANEASLMYTLSGSGSIPANTVASSGPMTIRFTSDVSTAYSGFELHTNCQTCVAPALTMEEISSTEATLTWDDAEGTMTAFQLVYGPTGFTIDEDDVIDVYTNIYTIENLTANTSYDAYLRVLCDDGNYSDWSQVYTFRTPCEAVSIPYTEDFETYTSGMPDCWTKSRSNTTSYPQITSYNSSKVLRSAGNTMFVSPMMGEDITTLQMVVDIRKEGASSGSLEIGVMSNPYDESTFEVVETIPTTETNYNMTEYTISFVNVTNNGSYIAFRQTSTVTNWYFDIDNIVVEPIPACPKPTAIHATNVTSTSASIEWQENGDAYTWNIEYGPAGFTPGTGTMLTDIMDNPYELTGLNATTSYDVYVQSDCGGGETSSWSVKCSFTTECATHELPFIENFTTSSLPNCWSKYSGIFGTATPIETTSGWSFTSTSVFGHVHPKVNIWGSSCNYWLVSPVIDLTTAETPVLSFNLALTAYASSSAPSSTSDDDKFIVAISTDYGATWSTDDAVIWNDGDPTADHSYSAISSTGEAIHIDLSDYVGQEIKIAFYGESTVSGGDNDLHIDAVMVYDGEIPTPCDVPTNLSSNNVQYNSANITWTAGGSESAWNLQWRAQNGTWTPVNNLTAANYNLTGLTAQTTYEVQVQAVCEGDATSEWTAIHSFTTPAAPAEPCDAPTNLQVGNITTNSAVATWTAGGSETSWKVGYKLQSASQWDESTVSTTTYTIEGLTANSTYDFRVKAVCSADNQSEFVTTSFTTNPEVGIDNVELANSVSLMPNPADNYIEMTVNGNIAVKEAVIYNAFGQMIQMVQLTDNHARINLDNYASGMYFVRVSGDNAVATKKFIKK